MVLYWCMQIGKVMRIQKAAKRNVSERSSSPTALSMHERLVWKDLEDVVTSSNRELASQLYVKHVMTPLLGPKFVDSGVCMVICARVLNY